MRVSPVKSQTIPRVGLVAALVLNRLIVTVHNSLEFESKTDSTVVLYWINNHKPWKQYVSSRVTEILKHTSRDK